MADRATWADEVAGQLIQHLGAPPSGLDDEALLALTAVAARFGRIIEAAQTRLAGEIAERSRPERGDDGLSRGQNYATPAALLSAVARVPSREARAALALGTRMRGAALLGGGTGDPPFPAVSAAMARGDLGSELAVTITRECTSLVQRGVDPAAVRSAEEQLVAAAVSPALMPDDVGRLAIRIRELLDPDGLEPRAETQHQARSFTLARSPDGMYRGRIALEPEAGAVWLGALQALVSPRTAPRFVAEDLVAEDPVAEDSEASRLITADTRSTPQKMADAATELITRAAASPELPRLPQLSGAIAVVNVHTTLAELEAGHGAGWVDGLDEPLPLSAIRRLRCSSPTVTTVFGDRGEILHHGKARRLFSPAQNRALAARDGGCVWPGCDRPPSWCESHHVEEWRSAAHPPGRTDIENGVLLCRFHHAHLHKASWRIEMRGGVPHIVPPRWIDIAQTPIPVTRRRTPLPGLLAHPTAPAPPVRSRPPHDAGLSWTA